ncbi:MAG: beta-galactosidase, partial [Planctomycetes bacterium]|nr:beta-galactosidase [Planctomycetota bacterium]
MTSARRLLALCAAVLCCSPSLHAAGFGEGDPTPCPNLVRNSSFEVGFDGYGITRAEYLTTGQRDVPYHAPVFDAENPYHGAVSLRLDNPDAGSVRLFTRPFAVDPHKRYLISFAARAGIAGQNLSVGLETAEGPYGEAGGGVAVGATWQRYTIGPVEVPAGRSLCKLQFVWGVYARIAQGAPLWLDAIQVREVPAADDAVRPLEVGIANGRDRQYTLASGEVVPVRIALRNNGAAPATCTLRYRVHDDFWNSDGPVFEMPGLVIVAGASVQRALADVSPHRRGRFTLQAELLDQGGAVADRSSFAFAVIDSVKRGLDQFTDDFTVSDNLAQGGGRPMGPEGESRGLWLQYAASADAIFDFRAEAGDRWIRSWDFAWCNIEPRDGEFDWTLPDILVQKARARGMRVMPVLGDDFILDNSRDPPAWLRSAPGSRLIARTMDPHQQVLLPSQERWVRYVEAIARRYRGVITTYEVLNEPNMYITPEVYRDYLASASAALKRIDPAITVVAFCTSQDHGRDAFDYLDGCLKAGALPLCDVVSFHPYGARLDWSAPLSAMAMNARVRTYVDQAGGRGKALWNTEMFHVCKPGAPGEDDNYLGRKVRGETLARRWLIDLATGMGRSFTVPDMNYFALFAPASWAVNSHLTVGMDPSTGFVVYNTLAGLFTGAKPRGEVAVGDTRKLYLFTSGASAIAAAWSFADDGRPAPLRIP